MQASWPARCVRTRSCRCVCFVIRPERFRNRRKRSINEMVCLSRRCAGANGERGGHPTPQPFASGLPTRFAGWAAWPAGASDMATGDRRCPILPLHADRHGDLTTDGVELRGRDVRRCDLHTSLRGRGDQMGDGPARHGAAILRRGRERDRQVRDGESLVLRQRHQDRVGIGGREQPGRSAPWAGRRRTSQPGRSVPRGERGPPPQPASTSGVPQPS